MEPVKPGGVPEKKNEIQKEIQLSDLPDEILMLIFEKLSDDPKSLLQLAGVSRQFERLAYDKEFPLLEKMKDIAFKKLGSPDSKPEVQKQAVEFLKKVIPQDTQEINLSGKQISDAEIKFITDHFTQLEVLNLSKTHVTPAQLKKLKGLKNLKALNLSGNRIGAEGAKALAEALKGNETLTMLNLENNNIGEKGAKALAEALKGNETLTMLNLKFNNIGDEGVKALNDALKENINLIL